MNDLTKEIYEASKPLDVRAMWTIDGLEARELKAAELDGKGFTIDRQVDIWGWDPVKVMAYRQSLGLTVVPAAALSGSTSPKFIKVSTNAADYPSIDSIPPPPPPLKPVGVLIGNGLYAANYPACAPNGTPIFEDGRSYPNVNGDGKTYVFHATPWWGMWSLNWTLA